VGDRLSIAQAAARWARTPDIQLVGGLLIEPDLDEEDIPSELLGSPIAAGLERAEEQVKAWAADTVLVAHGPGMTPTDFRRLAWSLESTGVSMGVVGVLESVAPHRITAGGLERETVMDVRPPRPSHFVRGVKFALDRVAAAVLLVVAAPLLLLAMIAVRVDTRGPAIFKQTRVGLHGREFEVYKVRTMVTDADAIKHQLTQVNEADAVLFKIRADPRVTRVGRLLRKTSLDELPQLVNVLKGDMSLVGPRPHLPSEIAAMDSDTLRRLAVRPGITGLWQVSGRSDLPFGMASELDTYYADNWTLSGDLSIGFRTIKAVATAKGAY
jgi:exopolysaccharide biosynthesis polyprenyl glycosylphosphotransferase